jgi:anti-sigma factor RsiW
MSGFKPNDGMNSDSDYNTLREEAWRRKLTPAEEEALRRWLSAHPESQGDWELEGGLNQALERLPDAPVPGNFTARVLRAVELDAAQATRRRPSFWSQIPWLPRVAFTALALGAGLFAYHHAQVQQHRKQMVAALTVVGVSSLPAPDVLKDYDAIQAMGQTSADDELLAALTAK